MRKHLFRWGLLCLVVLVACVARAQEPNIQEKELYSTDFSGYPSYSAADGDQTVMQTKTMYSHEDLVVSEHNCDVSGNYQDVIAENKWAELEPYHSGGVIGADKNVGSEIYISKLKSITKVSFVHGTTGSNRGWSLWAKGDGDADWVQLTTSYADNNPTRIYCEVNNVVVNRTNCELKFTNLSDGNYAYLLNLRISGEVDMSLYPALGSFMYNGTTYTAAEEFTETSPDVYEMTIELFEDEPMPTDGAITNVTVDNGDWDGKITYTTNVDGSVTASLVVTLGSESVTYKINFVRKQKFTLTYYNTDGTVLEATQQVEKDAKIGTLRGYDGVTVADGKAMRGWFVSPDGGEKYTTDYVVTSDLNLYAVATDIETGYESRYKFDLTDRYFYDEDHEAFNSTGSFHDTTHGWVLNNGDKVDLLVGGNATIMVSVCAYSGDNSTLTVTGTDGSEVATVNAKNATDGYVETINYTGGAGTVTLTANGTAYIHQITVANTGDYPIEPNEQGYYIVKPGDGGSLLNTLDVVNALPASEGRAYIFLSDGTYDLGREVLTPISRSNISIIGQSMDNTIVINEAPQEGIGVSATFFIDKNTQNTYMQDLTLKNAYDYYNIPGDGRAVVIQDKGDRTIFKNVRMLSYQDTYYPNNNGQYYLENSDIHGTVDFICGEGDVFFNNCTLTVEPRSLGGSGECTITAPSTDVNGGNKWGYVFNNCTIDNLAESFNFGRAWNNKPRCAFLNTTIKNDKLIKSRWRLEGLNNNIPDKFVEYNTVNEEGTVISPTENNITFTGASAEVNTIISADEAAQYTLDNVFPDWTPDEYAAQKELGLLKADGSRLTWDAVDGVTAYAVFLNGKFVAMTSTSSYDITEGEADDYTVRAANAHGGFGRPASTTYTSGIDSVEADGDVVSTAYYSIQGSRVSDAYKGIVIKVDTMADGTVKTTKMMK